MNLRSGVKTQEKRSISMSQGMYGSFGGQYVPEVLMATLEKVEKT